MRILTDWHSRHAYFDSESLSGAKIQVKLSMMVNKPLD